MEEKRKGSHLVNNAVHHINDVADRLKFLHESSIGDLDGERSLNAFRDIAQMILENEIKNLNAIMEVFSQYNGGIEYYPVGM